MGVRSALRRGGAPIAVATLLTMTLVGVDVMSHPGGPTRPSLASTRSHVDIVTTHQAAAQPLPTPRSCGRRAAACVDRTLGLAWLQRAGRISYGPVPVALGRRGHRTPIGRFHVAWKAARWTSTEYGIPMPWSVFFAAGGIAFHAGPLHQRSHGCVHLRWRDAKRFFATLEVGDVVVVRR